MSNVAAKSWQEQVTLNVMMMMAPLY